MESKAVILEKEIGNDKFIYLYESLNGWRAFERSAFHFVQIFKTGKLILSDDLVVMEVDKELRFLKSPAMRLGEIILVGDSEVHFECNESLGNFDIWRSNIAKNDRIKMRQDITYDEIDKLFFEFIDKQKIYLHRGMSAQKASLMMGVPVAMLNGYALNECGVLFEEMIHNYRIADAEDFWSKSPRMSVFYIAKSVGYANVIEFVYHFISRNKCIPSVWKRRYGII